MLGDGYHFAFCDCFTCTAPICGFERALDFTSERSGDGLAFLLPSEPRSEAGIFLDFRMGDYRGPSLLRRERDE
jgi:hypothetical protein